MQFPIRVFTLGLVLLLSTGAADVSPASDALPQDHKAEVKVEDLNSLLDTLEDSKQREQLIESLRTLVRIKEEKAGQSLETASVKSAAAEAVELLATKISALSGSMNALLDGLGRSPVLVEQWLNDLTNPEIRQRWLLTGGRLLAVLGGGYISAFLLAWAARRIRRRDLQDKVYTPVARLARLFGYLLVDLLPILVFAVVTYTILTLTDPRQETRLVAVALINASILSRIVMVVAAFLLAPDHPQLRLWGLSEETAYYMNHWVKRISVISIFGFFGLQASLLLGLDFAVYETLLRLLGLVLVGLLLVLVAQNREPVARWLSGDSTQEDKALTQLTSLRKGFARVWHLIAGLYFILVYAIWALRIQNGAQFVLKATLMSLMIVAVTHLLLRVVNRLFERGLRLSEDLRNRFPGLEHRLNRYFPALSTVVKVGVWAFAVLLIANAWGISALQWLTEGSGKILLGAFLNILLILVIAVFLWELASGAISRYLSEVDTQGNSRIRSPRIRTLLTVARNALLVVLTLVSTLMVLSELGINIAPLLAGAGVVGLAIGFGAQRLVQDVINGVFILFQDLMSVGDVVKLGDKAGVVEALSIRTVRLRDLSGTVHTIPFSAIEGVSNLTREFSYHVFDLGIAYREDVDVVIELIKQVGEELRADPEIGPLILEPLEVFGLDAFGDSAIVIKGRIKTRPIKQWQVGRAFNRLVKRHFDERGIEIPFPHRTIYFGQEKDGTAPPAFLQVEQMLNSEPPPGRSPEL